MLLLEARDDDVHVVDAEAEREQRHHLRERRVEEAEPHGDAKGGADGEPHREDSDERDDFARRDELAPPQRQDGEAEHARRADRHVRARANGALVELPLHRVGCDVDDVEQRGVLLRELGEPQLECLRELERVGLV